MIPVPLPGPAPRNESDRLCRSEGASAPLAAKPQAVDLPQYGPAPPLSRRRPGRIASEHRPAESRGPTRPITSIISAHWSGPLPPPAELEKIDQIIPGGADRLLRMAEKEQTHRIEDAKRGQYLGWSLAAGAVIAAAVVSLCRGPWQVSVALAHNDNQTSPPVTT
jgi:hypothetical protein